MNGLNIHAGVVILWVISALCVWVAFKAFNDDEGFGALMLLGIAFGFGSWGYHEANPQTAIDRATEERQMAEQRAANETPHVVREADGCKVYAFLSVDKWHYFTKCPNSQVTTDSTYTECTGSGKTRSCKDKVETIVTN